jgi:flavin-dependent dehydrogenase
VEENQWIKNHLAAGTQSGQYVTTGEYSYRSKFSAIDGLVLCGDAFGFLDPVFSSGVTLALKSGTLVADTIDECFKAGDFSATRFIGYGNHMKQGIENMRKLVYAFYDLNFSFRKLTDKYPETHGLITDCLSGDVNKDYTWLYERCAEMAQIPDELPCGDAMVLSAGAAGE